MEVRSEGTEHLPPHLGVSIKKAIVRLKVTTREPVFISPGFLMSVVKIEPNRIRYRGFPPNSSFPPYLVALAGI